MRANYYFLKAVHSCTHSKNLKEGLDDIEKAQKIYSNIDDRDRWVKCFNVQGKLYIELSKTNDDKAGQLYRNKAKKAFDEGVLESKNLIRLDQEMKNLLSLAELDFLSEKEYQEYISKGISLSKRLKNVSMQSKFQELAELRHI